MRRVLRERRIGHTGTLDPLASGVLPLVIGRATRLARFLSGSDKSYEAVIRLGVATDTGDAEGSPVGEAFTGALPTVDVIDRALDAFRGQFEQQPPVFSAKKVGGQRSYDVARGRRGQVRTGSGPDTDPTRTRVVPESYPSPLAYVPVTVAQLTVTRFDGDALTLTLTCSAGFYVRALARDLGARLGTGGHLAALRRTRVGTLTLEAATPLADAERDPAATAARLVPLSQMLTEWPAATLDADGVRRACQGRDVPGIGTPDAGFVRLTDESGDLIAIAEPSPTTPGLLHPFVVLR